MKSLFRQERVWQGGAAMIAALFTLGLPMLLAQPALAQREGRTPRIDPSDEAKARKLLRRMIEAEVKRAFQAREATFRTDGPGTEQMVKRDPKRGARRESIRPPGIIWVDDFKRSYTFDPREKRVRESESVLPRLDGPVIQEAIKRIVRDGLLTAEVVGEDRVLGRVADIVEVRHPRQKGPSRRFWIDRQTGLRLKTEEIAADGRVLSGSYYLSLDLKPKFTDDDFMPPQGAGTTQMGFGRKRFNTVEEAKKAGVDLRVPSYLPAGFVLRVIDAGERGGNVTLRYSDGLNFISLAQLKRQIPPIVLRRFSDGESGFLNFPRGQRGYVRRDGDLTLLLISSLPDEELKRIADSVR